jgi:hypothetical protein
MLFINSFPTIILCIFRFIGITTISKRLFCMFFATISNRLIKIPFRGLGGVKMSTESIEIVRNSIMVQWRNGTMKITRTSQPETCIVSTSSFLHISTSPHLHIFTSPHLHISTSSHLHISTSPHLHISQSPNYLIL